MTSTERRDSIISYHNQDNLTFREIGKLFNISFQRAHQIYHGNKHKEFQINKTMPKYIIWNDRKKYLKKS